MFLIYECHPSTGFDRSMFYREDTRESHFTEYNGSHEIYMKAFLKVHQRYGQRGKYKRFWCTLNIYEENLKSV